MNCSILSLLVFSFYESIPFFFVDRNCFMIKDSFFKKVSAQMFRVFPYSDLSIRKCSFSRIIGNIVSVGAIYSQIVESPINLNSYFSIIDSEFRDFPSNSFEHVFNCNENSSVVTIVRCRFVNLNAKATTTICLINILSALNATMVGLCFSNCVVGHACICVNSHTNNIKYTYINQTCESSIRQALSSRVGGRNEFEYYYNNITNAMSHSSRSSLCILTCPNKCIGGYSYFKNNNGTSMVLISANVSSFRMESMLFINNTNYIGWFEIINYPSFSVFHNCGFFQINGADLLTYGGTVHLSSLSLSSCVYDYIPSTSQITILSIKQDYMNNYHFPYDLSTKNCHLSSINRCPTIRPISPIMIQYFLVSTLIINH